MPRKSNYLVYGQQGCGKTINADAICKHLGADGAIDADDERAASVENYVIFTNDESSDFDFTFEQLKRIIPIPATPNIDTTEYQCEIRLPYSLKYVVAKGGYPGESKDSALQRYYKAQADLKKQTARDWLANLEWDGVPRLAAFVMPLMTGGRRWWPRPTARQQIESMHWDDEALKAAALAALPPENDNEPWIEVRLPKGRRIIVHPMDEPSYCLCDPAVKASCGCNLSNEYTES